MPRPGDWRLKGCPRCEGGDLYWDYDTHAEEWACLQCGHRPLRVPSLHPEAGGRHLAPYGARKKKTSVLL